MKKVTADTLIQNGWHNSWIDGIRRWHHDRLMAHFKSLADAKKIYLEYQLPPPAVPPSERTD